MALGRFRSTTTHGVTLKTRRAEVVERLAACGLTRGPRRVVRAFGAADDASELGRKLRRALERLGPVFASFGLYLATRVDLLDARDCLQLAAIADDAPPMTAAAARDIFRRELEREAADTFLSFEADPFESRLLQQSHRAQLLNGAPVVVKLVRPEAEQECLRDLELLDTLEDALAGTALGGPSFKAAVADFNSTLRRRLDLRHEAKALETLARDAEGFEMLRVPAVERQLCAERVLTVEELAGVRLDGVEFARASEGEGTARARRGLPRVFDRTALARLLCSVWLRQALLGQTFPVEPQAAGLVVISDRQIAFTGGPFASLHAEAQKNLWNYLIATSAEKPDRACSCLLGELRREGRAGEDLRHRFRQVVPFRDSGWHQDDGANQLAEHLVVHWRAAAGCGYVPQPHLPAFYRGLFAITSAAQQLSPESDPLLEGLQDARLQESLSRVREMMSLHQLGEQADRYAALMVAMPTRLDEMLSLASNGGPRLKIHAPEADSGRRRRNSTAAVTALLLLLAGVVMLLPRATAALASEVWASRINTLVFILLGAMLLRAAGRTV
jgi:ubiquinone biosynthesis protein